MSDDKKYEVGINDPVREKVRDDPSYQDLRGVLVKGLKDAINPDTIDEIVKLQESGQKKFITNLFNQIVNNPDNQHLGHILEATNVDIEMRVFFESELSGNWDNVQAISQNKHMYEALYAPILLNSIANETLVCFKKFNLGFVPRLN